VPDSQLQQLSSPEVGGPQAAGSPAATPSSRQRRLSPGGPAGVGVALGRAVRTSIVAVNVIDLFLSMAIWGTTTTVRLAG